MRNVPEFGTRLAETIASQTASLKVLAFIIIIIVGLVIDLGGAPTGDRLGFRYWRGERFNDSSRRPGSDSPPMFLRRLALGPVQRH